MKQSTPNGDLLVTQSSVVPGGGKTLSVHEDSVTRLNQVGASTSSGSPFGFYYNDIQLGDYVWFPLGSKQPANSSAQLGLVTKINNGMVEVLAAYDSTFSTVQLTSLMKLSEVRKRYVVGMWEFSRLRAAVMEDVDVQTWALGEAYVDFCFGVNEFVEFPKQIRVEGRNSSETPGYTPLVVSAFGKSEQAGEDGSTTTTETNWPLIALIGAGALIVVYSTSN